MRFVLSINMTYLDLAGQIGTEYAYRTEQVDLGSKVKEYVSRTCQKVLEQASETYQRMAGLTTSNPFKAAHRWLTSADLIEECEIGLFVQCNYRAPETITPKAETCVIVPINRK